MATNEKSPESPATGIGVSPVDSPDLGLPHQGYQRREFLGAMAGGTQAAPSPQPGRLGAKPSARPNVLVIMADQLVPFLTGAYGNATVKTPNLDLLTRRGVRFDAAYSANPLCAPARACLMTGKYSSRIGVHDNAAPMACDELTIAHHFARAGYDTAWSGKMHYVGPDQHHGLHRRISHDIYPADFSWVKPRDRKTPGEHARNYISSGVHVGREDRGKDATGSPKGNLALDEEAHSAALQYLQARKAQPEQPFFLGVSYNYPHEPFWPGKREWDLYEGTKVEIPEYPSNLEDTYSVMDRWLNRHHAADRYPVRDGEGLKKLHRAYYALVTLVDRWVGELVEAIERNGFGDNTVVVFTSDHGDMLGHKGMVQKRSFYEWSARVPLVVADPRGRFAGTSVPEPVSLIDILPTLLDLTGLENGEAPGIDGSSLVPLMEGRRDGGRTIFSESHSEGMHATCFLARRGRWKYTYIHGHAPQLFDVVDDPGEWRNLAGRPETREVEREMRGLILSRFDPEKIEKQVRESIDRRLFALPAMRKTSTDWTLSPDAVV